MEDTFYPMDDKIQFTVSFPDKADKTKTLEFPFHLRIPGWCDEAVISVNGVQQMTAKRKYGSCTETCMEE